MANIQVQEPYQSAVDFSWRPGVLIISSFNGSPEQARVFAHQILDAANNLEQYNKERMNEILGNIE